MSVAGDVERAFKKMRSAASTFSRAAGSHSATFIDDFPFFQQCLQAFRVTILDELAWMVHAFKIEVIDELAVVLPRQDVSFVPGFEPDDQRR